VSAGVSRSLRKEFDEPKVYEIQTPLADILVLDVRPASQPGATGQEEAEPRYVIVLALPADQQPLFAAHYANGAMLLSRTNRP
jgi:hypothetical protein